MEGKDNSKRDGAGVALQIDRVQANDFDIPTQAERRGFALGRGERHVEPLCVFAHRPTLDTSMAILTSFGPFLACTSSSLSSGMARLALADRFMTTCCSGSHPP